MACQWYENKLIEFPLGLTGGIVQIDETALRKAKYHKGSALKRNCNWVVGAVDTQTKRLAVQSVSERNALTLKELIQHSVIAGSIIYTDKWPAYNCLSDIGFHHFTVNHNIQFVNRLRDGTNVHPQNIESRWRGMKRYLHCHNASYRKFTNEYVQTYAAKFNAGNIHLFQV